MYVWYGTNEFNFVKLENPPDFEPTHCAQCERIITMGEEGFSVFEGRYYCEACAAKRLGILFG
jgi:hypothetical protein